MTRMRESALFLALVCVTTAGCRSSQEGGDGGTLRCCERYCDELTTCLDTDVPDCVTLCETTPGTACESGLALGESCDDVFADACESGLLLCETTTTAFCDDYCEALCEYASGCGSEVPTEECRTDCESGLTPFACSIAEAPDRMSCEDALQQTRCTGYCDLLCEAAADCVTLDIEDCKQKCVRSPIIGACDVATIEARECPQLRAEGLCYDPPLGSFSSECVGGGPETGLCEQTEDCAETDVCDSETHLCGACTSDEECADHDVFTSGLGGPWVCEEGSCARLECDQDIDCPIERPACDTETNECVECVDGRHCSLVSPDLRTCDTETHTCVGCIDDGDCRDGQCDPATRTCVGCLQDDFCASDFLSGATGTGICDPATRSCVDCVDDTQCTLPDPTGLTSQVLWPACDVATNSCVECVDESHCEPGEICDTQRCVAM